MTNNPINAASIPKKTAIINGARGDCATISISIRSQMMPPLSQTGMIYATTKAPKNPIIDPRILCFLSLKITYKITNEILMGINNKNSGNIYKDLWIFISKMGDMIYYKFAQRREKKLQKCKVGFL